jgi:hypothetical protein
MEVEKVGSESGRQAPVERLWERSREERKETNSEAKYRNLEGRHERSGRRERGDRGSESGDGHWGSNCEAEPGREGKEEQRLSSQNPKLRRTKECRNSGGQKAERKRRQAVEWTAQKRKKRKLMTRVSRKKQLQRLNPTEDEMKLQMRQIN